MRFKGIWSDTGDELMRRIIVKLHSLPPEIRELEIYERCYNNSLLSADPNATLPWELEYDSLGNFVPQGMRKPNFKDPLPREIVDNLTSAIFGSDHYPALS